MDNNLEVKVEEIRRRQEAMEAAQSEFLRSELKAVIQSELKACIQSELKAAIQSEVKAAIQSEFTLQVGYAPKDLDLGLGRETEPGENPKQRPPSSTKFEEEDALLSTKFGMITENWLSPSEDVPGKKQHVQFFSEEDPLLSTKFEEEATKFGMIMSNFLEEECEERDGRSRVPLRYDIFVVDADGGRSLEVDEYTHIAPTAHFKFVPEGNSPAVCGVKSTVYVFEGIFGGNQDHIQGTPKQKAAYKINFQTPDGELTGIPHMKRVKSNPIALPTPDGDKILVFSKNFLVKESDRAFELYHIKDESWTQVPPLPCLDSCTRSDSRDAHWCLCKGSDDVEATAYGFVGGSRFLLQTCLGVFVLDLNERKWTRLCVQKVAPNDHEGYFDIVKDRYLLVPRMMPVMARCTGDVGGPPTADHLHLHWRYGGDVAGPPALWACDFGDGFLAEDDMNIDDLKFPKIKNEDWCRLSAFPHGYWRIMYELSILPLRPNEQQDGVCTNLLVQVDSESGPESRIVSILVNVCGTDLATIKTSVYKAFRLTYNFSEAERPIGVTLFNI